MKKTLKMSMLLIGISTSLFAGSDMENLSISVKNLAGSVKTLAGTEIKLKLNQNAIIEDLKNLSFKQMKLESSLIKMEKNKKNDASTISTDAKFKEIQATLKRYDSAISSLQNQNEILKRKLETISKNTQNTNTTKEHVQDVVKMNNEVDGVMTELLEIESSEIKHY